jgi:hypothetical protein
MNKSRRMGLARYAERVVWMGNAHKILVGNPEGKRSLGKPKRRWENNIKLILKKLGRGVCVLDWEGDR